MRLLASTCGLTVFLCLAILQGCEAMHRPTYKDNKSSIVGRPRAASDIAPDPAPAPDPYVRETLAYPTGDPATSAVLLQRIMPAEIQINNPFDYELVITNLRDMTLRNVVVADEQSAHLTINSSTPTVEPTQQGLQWSIGELGPRQAKTIQVNATATSTQDLNSCASLSYEPVLCAAHAVVQPVLEIALAAPAETLLCEVIPIRAHVANTGTGTARNVTVNVTLPEEFILETAAVPLTVEGLAAGQSRDFTLLACAKTTGTYLSNATATADGGLSADANAVNIVVRQPVLSVEKTGPAREFIDRNFTWQIVVKNTGDAPARNVIMEDVLPAQAEFITASHGGQLSGKSVRWVLGTIAPDTNRTVTLTAVARGDGEVASLLTVQAECADQATARAEMTFVGIAAILMEVVDNTDPIEYGKDVIYTIEVTNQGTAAATGIVVVCTLPDGEEFIAARGATDGRVEAGEIRFSSLATLPPKANAVWTVTARAVKVGDVRFKVAITSDQLYTPVEESESTTLYE